MITLTSPAFDSGTAIPKKYTGEGEDVSPPLVWTDAPEQASEFALICDDPDAPRPEPWVHWVVYKIPSNCHALEEGGCACVLEGMNSWERTGYGGPMPPPGHGVHRYYFRLYALNQPLELDAGATKPVLLEAMKGHLLVVAELMGTYER
jgi:Raf kinase inhibitor-like YbhB/YbcL family protein